MAHGNHGHQPGATHEAVPLDPEHDIDARSATIWVLVGTVVLFLSLWVMVPIFVRVQEQERQGKVYGAPAAEHDLLKDQQMTFLKGENPTKKSIEQVVQGLRK